MEGGLGGLPGVTDADNVVDVAEGKFQQLVRENARSVCKSEKGMIRKYRP